MLDYKNEPDFLTTIIKGINDGHLVLFVGSGISKLCGLPLWKELAVSLLNFCAEDSSCNFSYKQLDEILKYIDDERELISIAKNLLRKTYKSDDAFNEFFYKKLHVDVRKNKQGEKIQKLLFGISKIIFTTNADDILDKGLNKENVIVDKDKIGNYKSDFEHKVIHIHGSIKKPSDLVFTTADYLERYSNKIFRETIKNLFSVDSQYTILFIGYGFREMQLLDFLVNVESREIRRNKTFVLNGYFSNQEDVFEAESDYYKQYGVTLISYLKDDKNYKGLIDALEYIQDEAKQKSLVRYHDINKLKKIIETNSKGDSVRKIRNEINILSEQEKKYLLDKISKSNKSKKWTEKIILDKRLQKEIFSLDNLISSKCTQSKENNIETSFPGLSLLASVDCYGTNTKKFYLDFISKIEDAYLTNINLFSNHIVYKSFLKLLFSQTDFLLENKTFEFLNSFINHSSDPSIWMLFASSYNTILKHLPIDKCFRYFELMVTTLIRTQNVTYDFIDFYEVYLDFYCTHFARDIINRLLASECKTFDNYRYSYDTYEILFSQEIDLIDMHTYLKKWLGKSILYLKKEDILELYNNLLKSKDTFSILTAIYIANVHFDELNYIFLDNIQYLNLDRIYFSEIYSAIKNNIEKLNLQQLNKIISFVDSLNYGNEYVTTFCKLDILHMLQNSFFNYDLILNKINELHNFLAINHAEAEYKRIVPLDRSKSFFVSVDWKSDEDLKLKDKILSMSFDEFIVYLKSYSLTEREFSIHEISTYLDELNSKFDFFSDSTLSKLNGLPNEFLNMLENYVTRQNLNLGKKFELIKKLESLKSCLSSKTSLLNSIYFILNDVKKMDSKIEKNIFEYINTIIIDKNDDGEENIYNFVSNNLFSNNEFLKVSILIKTCSREDFALFSKNLEKHLDHNRNYAKAAMSAHIQYLWSLDNKWTTGKLKNIFSNEINKHNLSFYAFSFSQLYNVNFINELYKQGILEQLLNSNEFKGIAWKYTYLLMCNYVYSDEMVDIVKVIAKTSYYQYSLSRLINFINTNNRNRFNKAKFDKMLEVLMSNGEKNENMFCCGIDLIKFLNVDEINDIEEKFILFAFSNSNSSFYCEELSNIIKSKCLNCEVSDKFIKEFLIHMSDCFYNEDEIKELFKLIKDKETKMVVLNALGEINPMLLTIFEV